MRGRALVGRDRQLLEHERRAALVGDVRPRASHVLGEQHLVAVVAEHVVQVVAHLGEGADPPVEELDRLGRHRLRRVAQSASRLAQVVQRLGVVGSVGAFGAPQGAVGLIVDQRRDHLPGRVGGERRERRIGEERLELVATRERSRKPLPLDEPRVREAVVLAFRRR